MHFVSQQRYNPKKQADDDYYRLKESYRDLTGRVRCRIMLNVGFIEEDVEPTAMGQIGKCLSYMYDHQGQEELFGGVLSHYSEQVQRLSRKYWEEILKAGSVDALRKSVEDSREKAERLVDVDTVKHTDARDVGAEWICLQAIRELEIDKFFACEGWGEVRVNTALAELITRTVYAPSELKSIRIMDENSAVCELLTGGTEWRPKQRQVYGVAPSLLELKEKLENHLCRRTDDLFNINNRIVLFDLTNFYFEGRKDGSDKAQFGRSKEKRSDCKLLVMALCINQEGFIRYSSILAGNTSDPKSLPDMVDTIARKNRVMTTTQSRALVCLDAGIATEDNLKEIEARGYDYLCVSRRRLAEYELVPDAPTVKVRDVKNQEISLSRVKHEEGGDYYREIKSPAKALKESSMKRNFKERFEPELQKAKDSLSKKGGKKNYESVVERVGRARQKYPSIVRYYVVDYCRDEQNPKNMKDIQWRIAVPENVDKDSGKYFLRTNIDSLDEKTTWDYYNLTREIECTNRQLKLDLNLRPIYHQKDDRSDAHLFLGLLSYWVVNTIRYKLKQSGMNCYWSEIVRIMSSQKAITTEAVNALGEKVHLRLCSEPNKTAEDVYDRLRYKRMPFRRIKIEKSL